MKPETILDHTKLDYAKPVADKEALRVATEAIAHRPRPE